MMMKTWILRLITRCFFFIITKNLVLAILQM